MTSRLWWRSLTAAVFLALAAPAEAVCTNTSSAGISDAATVAALNEMCSYLAGIAAGTGGSGNVQGVAAEATAEAANPVTVSGIYEGTLPTYATGQKARLHVGTRGSLHAELWSSDGVVASTISGSGADGASNGNSLLVVGARAFMFNGATWDRAFTCASQVSATVTAAATTQLVALVSSQIIRVCSYQVGIATTGTFKFVQGTGTNCGTGTADITPATNLTAGNVALLAAPAGGAIFRTTASNALCLAAVTGNVQVFVNYAQY